MLDARLRAWLEPALTTTARPLSRLGACADAMTMAGFVLGIAAAICIAMGAFWTALALIGLNRIADGLDGAIARATRPTDRGGFLDISLDFIFYAAVPLGFAVHDPGTNAFPAACLIASFLANGSTFLAFAAIAGKRGASPPMHEEKAFTYLAGLAEGTETIFAFVAFCLWPSAFCYLALSFSAICALSAGGRIVLGYRVFASSVLLP